MFCEPTTFIPDIFVNRIDDEENLDFFVEFITSYMNTCNGDFSTPWDLSPLAEKWGGDLEEDFNNLFTLFEYEKDPVSALKTLIVIFPSENDVCVSILILSQISLICVQCHRILFPGKIMRKDPF